MNLKIGTIALALLTSCSLHADEAPPAANVLFQAIRTGNRDAIQTALKTGDIRGHDELGETPFMAAALNSDASMLDFLLKANADVNATNNAGATALMRAATFEDKTKLLVAHGADTKARSRLGNTPLILAAREAGNSGTVSFLLEHGADPNVTNVFGATALMVAAASQDLDSVRILLDHGAEVNAKPNMDVNGFIWGGGRTALMWAAFNGDEPLIKLLLERGAKVNDFVVAGGALSQAAWGSHAGAARLLLEAGAKVDDRDLLANYTPLHWACSSERSSPELAELLLSHGADPNAEGGQPVDNFLATTQTPLSLARKRGNLAIINALFKAGAKEDPAVARAQNASNVKQIQPAFPNQTVADAIQRALPTLTKSSEESVPTFLRHASKQQCISCHQQQLPLTAISLAGSRHFLTDSQATHHQLELLKESITTGRIKQGADSHTTLEIELESTFHPEPTISGGYTSLILDLQHEPSSPVTDAMVHQLATMQHADGHWSWNLPRPPIQASDIGATSLAIHSLKFRPIPARRQEFGARVQRASAWLATARAETNEERVHQLLGLAWAGDASGLRKNLAAALLTEQRPDGGWGQLAGLESDAYATGQALYALMEAGGVPSSAPALRRGFDYLLRTQLADGTWHVHRRAHPFQPPMESGFPHGADGWISCAGTSWAVIALSTSLDPAKPLQITPAIAQSAPSAQVVAASLKSSVPIEFTRDIQPLLERSCVACHSGERAKGHFQVTDRASILRGGARGEPAVVPGKPDSSVLIRFVQDQVEDLEMPPVSKRAKFPALTKEESARLYAWIDQGAQWPDGTTLHPPSPK